MVLFRGFGDSSLNFEVRFWTTGDVFVRAESAVTGSIYAALAREGIRIPFPQRDLHLRSVDGEAGRRLGSGSGGRGPSGNGD
jgi:small-conductance mechanosensitive channel